MTQRSLSTEPTTIRKNLECFARHVATASLRGDWAKPNGSRDSGADQDRTDDLRLAKPALSQLSYSPNKRVGQGRLELPTSRLSGVRSNHLSYGPQGRQWVAGPESKPHVFEGKTLGPSKLNPITSETATRVSREATPSFLNRVGFDLKVFIHKVNETP